MTSARYRYAAILTVVIFGSAVWLLGPTFSPDPAAQAQPAAAAKRTPGRIIPMPAQSVALEFDLGLKDEKATDWDGEVQVSEGRIAAMRVVRGGPKARVDGNRYVARTVSRMQKQKPVIVRPLLQVTVEASPAANVTLKTAHGTVTFALKDLAG